MPTGQDVADFLGRGDDSSLVDLAAQHVTIVKAMAYAYTRGRGFAEGEPSEDVAAVIVTATARLVSNPEQLPSDVGNVSIRGGFTGWSLAETFVLNRYRRMAR